MIRLKKSFVITITTLLTVAFLTISVGKVTRVSAVATSVVAVASAATLAVGIGFLSYCALSGMVVNCPDAIDNIESWLTDIGQKVIQYPSGRAAYQDIYQDILNEPATGLLDRAWDWTKEKILSFANDFSDTRVISEIVGYVDPGDTFLQVTNQYEYPFEIVAWPQVINMNLGSVTFSQFLELYGGTIIHGEPILYRFYSTATQDYEHGLTYVLDPSLTLRNVLHSNGRYGVQVYRPDTGDYIDTSLDLGIDTVNGIYRPGVSSGVMNGYGQGFTISYSPNDTVPPLTQAETYIEETGEIIETIELTDVGERVEPEWPDVLDPDDEVEYPIVPYVQYPVDIYGGGSNLNPKWGFNLNDLLDNLADLGEALFDISVLKTLLNSFAGDHSGDSYIYYDYSENGNTYNNYNYFSNVNYGDDYVTYNIDVSNADKELPVDLNTIQIYTNNSYIESFKRSAIAGSSIIRDLVVFWYDVDPEIVYVAFGACIITLIAAFIGKWGHS